MKLGIREKLTVVFMLGLELAFLEAWLRLAHRSLWDYVSLLIP